MLTCMQLTFVFLSVCYFWSTGWYELWWAPSSKELILIASYLRSILIAIAIDWRTCDYKRVRSIRHEFLWTPKMLTWKHKMPEVANSVTDVFRKRRLDCDPFKWGLWSTVSANGSVTFTRNSEDTERRVYRLLSVLHVAATHVYDAKMFLHRCSRHTIKTLILKA